MLPPLRELHDEHFIYPVEVSPGDHERGPFLAAGPKLEEFGALSSWGGYKISFPLPFLFSPPHQLCALVEGHRLPLAPRNQCWCCWGQTEFPKWKSQCRIALETTHPWALVRLGMATGSNSLVMGTWCLPRGCYLLHPSPFSRSGHQGANG